MDIYQIDGMEKQTRVPRETPKQPVWTITKAPQQPIWTISKPHNNQSEL